MNVDLEHFVSLPSLITQEEIYLSGKLENPVDVISHSLLKIFKNYIKYKDNDCERMKISIVHFIGEIRFN